MFHLIGLGNPGTKYTLTRHNIGFLAIDRISGKLKTAAYKNKFEAELADFKFNKETFYLLKPQTFMNNSGQAAGMFAGFYKIDPKNILVLVDDCYLDFGKLRIRKSGSDGGHNGLKSLISHIGRDFPRIRCGIGLRQGRLPLEKYVLQEFSKKEKEMLDDYLDFIYTAVMEIFTNGIDVAMNKFNGSVLAESEA